MTLSPTQRIRRWRVFLLLWSAHRWLGLGAGGFIVLASLTGSLLVMHHEIERSVWVDRHRVSLPTADAPPAPALADVIRAVAPAAPTDYRAFRIEPGAAPDEAHKLIFSHPETAARWSALFDPHTGRVLWQGPDQGLFTPWLLHLHMHLHAGPLGYLFMGGVALALTLLSVSGIWITRGRLRTLLRRPVRLDRGWRVAASDLHRWTGLVGIYFSFVLGATGVWFACIILPGPNGFGSRPTVGPAFDLAQLAPLEPTIAAAQHQWPGAELVRISLPRDVDGAVEVRVLHREAPVWQKQSRLEADAITGAVRRVRDARDAPWTAQFRSILAPLHFGLHGSPLTKGLYAVGGLTPTVLSVTGAFIWWHRRQSRREPRSALT